MDSQSSTKVVFQGELQLGGLGTLYILFLNGKNNTLIAMDCITILNPSMPFLAMISLPVFKIIWNWDEDNLSTELRPGVNPIRLTPGVQVD